MSDVVEIEAKQAPPLVECVNCGHLLPQGLGEITCKVCDAVCRVSHQPTVDALKSETLPCPHCSTIVVAGSAERPLDVSCPACTDVGR